VSIVQARLTEFSGSRTERPSRHSSISASGRDFRQESRRDVRERATSRIPTSKGSSESSKTKLHLLISPQRLEILEKAAVKVKREFDDGDSGIVDEDEEEVTIISSKRRRLGLGRSLEKEVIVID
jgi:hypothetical protein